MLIHGNSSCRHAFAGFYRGEIAGRCRLIAFDLPGHGASDDAAEPERTYSIPAYADLAIEILDRLGVTRAAVLGWSLGGHVGLELMARWPGLTGLAIVGTPPIAPNADAIAAGFRASPLMALAGKEHFSETEALAYARATCGAEAIRRDKRLVEAVRRTDGRARSWMMRRALEGAGVDGRAVAEAGRTPLAIVSGADEPFVDNDYLAGLARALLWRRGIHLVAGAGHAPFLEAPAAFDRLLTAFLSDVPDSADCTLPFVNLVDASLADDS